MGQQDPKADLEFRASLDIPDLLATKAQLDRSANAVGTARRVQRVLSECQAKLVSEDSVENAARQDGRACRDRPG